MLYRSWAEINLKNLEDNIKNIYMYTKKDIFAVVKADAYGHGALNVGKFLEGLKQVKYLCVATAVEGKELKDSNIKKPILVLGGILEDEIDIFNQYGLIPVISDFNQLELIKYLKRRKIHLKFDTGMHRLGFYKEDIPEILNRLKDVEIEGLMSHFPSADIDEEFTQKQIRDFYEIVKTFKKHGITPEYIHLQNSAGITYDCPYCNSIRVGLAIYGSKPVKDFPVSLKQVMEVKAKVISIKNIKKGSPVSYTGSFVAKKDMKIGVVSFGYADGLPRSLSNRGYFLINGKKAAIIGNITMDMTVVDISDISNINIGDEVVIVGKSGNRSITFEDIAELTGTIPYEIMCGISKRVYRKFLERKENEAVINTGSR